MIKRFPVRFRHARAVGPNRRATLHKLDVPQSVRPGCQNVIAVEKSDFLR
jgi:hypothetical protein